MTSDEGLTINLPSVETWGEEEAGRMILPNEFRFDKRVMERNLRTGTLSEDELKRYLQTLEDRQEDALTCESMPSSHSRRLPTQLMENEEEDL